MNQDHLIHTEHRECQDCSKCVRHCPVKAIRIENHAASVIPELCVGCGACVSACPNEAKRVRDDLPHAQALLAKHERVFVSLAPSWPIEFPDLTPGALIAALKRLGFAGVSETALGAQEVSSHVARLLAEGPPRLLLSSACPAAVHWLGKYRPELAAKLTPVPSPLLAHASLLRTRYGAGTGIVFIGPCIAKKFEAATRPDLLDAAITFADLRRWFAAERLRPSGLTPTEADRFVPDPAEEGALYPVDGGMCAGIKSQCLAADAECMSFSGLARIDEALRGLAGEAATQSLFLELLACEGGCVNGPGMLVRGETARKRRRIFAHAAAPSAAIPRVPTLPLEPLPPIAPIAQLTPDHQRLQEALARIGKETADDEKNCGGCGYETCRDFAGAMLENKAEPSMCVTHMRKLAQRKARALVEKIPSAVVIADANLRLLECNENFLHLFPLPEPLLQDGPAGLEGARLDTFVPFHDLFRAILQDGATPIDKDVPHGESILHVTLFAIEPGQVVAGILQDVTRPAVEREQIIGKAREVIRANLATVQQIAYLLGENAADTEGILQSIIRAYSASPVPGLAQRAPTPLAGRHPAEGAP